ncbi:FtsB family cell division protein [Mycobacterium vicinigordonae]|uniref:Septum formation initiator family protein n=1 Tax=Mycobacterium vicinigordonae TaxID=1719132 RepID=A0A7D6HSS7_9MYCO|nr:septum formation initiator family protein [Mycobacterium vicinigordonae]QLL06532.1 septum formation initiator family protein [Mycobacterium vicinigordonae]
MAAKSDPRRRSPASRPGKAGDSGRGRRSTSSSSKAAAKPVARPSSKPAQTAPDESRAATRSLQEHVVEPIKRSFTESMEQRSDQRLGFTARRAAILAAVMCVLTLTIAGPVRTYFAQRTEMEQLSASEAALRRQIAELEQRKGQLADPAYIAAQARERLGFVKPGDIPFQVQLPPGAATPQQPGTEPGGHAKNEPWYTSLWHTIADAPHLPPGANQPPEPAPVPPGSPTPTTPGG